MKLRAAVIVGSLTLLGCAQRAEEIRAASVSPILYQHMTCLQLAQEAARVSARANELAGVQDQRATGDAIATGVAIVIFWPAAFLVRGDGVNAAELSRLRGELEAVDITARQKNCNLQFRNRR